MFSYNRLQEIFMYLVSQSGPVSPNQIAQKFQISTRTLRNDIHILNKELKPYNTGIDMKRGSGYVLNATDDSLELIQKK